MSGLASASAAWVMGGGVWIHKEDLMEEFLDQPCLQYEVMQLCHFRVSIYQSPSAPDKCFEKVVVGVGL